MTSKIPIGDKTYERLYNAKVNIAEFIIGTHQNFTLSHLLPKHPECPDPFLNVLGS